MWRHNGRQILQKERSLTPYCIVGDVHIVLIRDCTPEQRRITLLEYTLIHKYDDDDDLFLHQFRIHMDIGNSKNYLGKYARIYSNMQEYIPKNLPIIPKQSGGKYLC